MTEEKSIRITCEGADMLPLKEFKAFQGELKWLEEKQYEKLKQSIVKDGFHDPIHVWKKPGEKKPRKMLDGHQRINTIGRMIGAEGYELPDGKLPIVWVIAETEKQAKRIILEKMSQYGRYDEDSIYKFVHEADIEWPDLKELVDFPAINMGKLAVGWFHEDYAPPDNFPEKDEDIETKYECPKCGYKFS